MQSLFCLHHALCEQELMTAFRRIAGDTRNPGFGLLLGTHCLFASERQRASGTLWRRPLSHRLFSLTPEFENSRSEINEETYEVPGTAHNTPPMLLDKWLMTRPHKSRRQAIVVITPTTDFGATLCCACNVSNSPRSDGLERADY